MAADTLSVPASHEVSRTGGFRRLVEEEAIGTDGLVSMMLDDDPFSADESQHKG
jgi:hypothetical protein